MSSKAKTADPSDPSAHIYDCDGREIKEGVFLIIAGMDGRCASLRFAYCVGIGESSTRHYHTDAPRYFVRALSVNGRFGHWRGKPGEVDVNRKWSAPDEPKHPPTVVAYNLLQNILVVPPAVVPLRYHRVLESAAKEHYEHVHAAEVKAAIKVTRARCAERAQP